MQAALDHLRAQGETLNDEDIARLSPLCHGHINMLGHYSFTLAELVTKGHLRPLKEASEAKTLLNVSFRSTERQTPSTDWRSILIDWMCHVVWRCRSCRLSPGKMA